MLDKKGTLLKCLTPNNSQSEWIWSCLFNIEHIPWNSWFIWVWNCEMCALKRDVVVLFLDDSKKRMTTWDTGFSQDFKYILKLYRNQSSQPSNRSLRSGNMGMTQLTRWEAASGKRSDGSWTELLWIEYITEKYREKTKREKRYTSKRKFYVVTGQIYWDAK